MAVLELAPQTTPSTPGAGLAKGFFDSVTKQWNSIDEAANVYPYLASWLTTTTADFTGTNVNTAQPIFGPTEDVITLPGGMSFILEAAFHIHTTGTTSHTLGLLFGGTAVLTSMGYQAQVTNAATEVLGAPNTIWAANASLLVVSAAVATASHHSVLLKGIVRVNTGGTFIPQYQWSAAPGVAGVTLANGYLQLTPFGANTRAAIGPWS